MVKGGYHRIPQYREIVDCNMASLAALKAVLAPDFQKAFVAYQTGAPAKIMFRMTNIMASNQSEIRFKARSTDPGVISKVQKHEHGHEALDPLLFPITVRRRMYSFLADSYTVVALDVNPKPGALAGYADRDELQSYAEEKLDAEPEGDEPKSRYRRAYQRTKPEKSVAERREDAYEAATTDAMLEDGVSVRARVIDPLTFKGWQTDEDPCRFALGMEYGRKQLNPLLEALSGFGVVEHDGCLYIEGDGKGEKGDSASYKALGMGMIADVQSEPHANEASDEYVDYIQFRDMEETVIYVGNPKGKVRSGDGEPGILIRVPNLFGNLSTGYYLIEGDPKLRSGDIEARYDPPLRNLLVEAQHYNITRSTWSAMAMAEGTRGLYQFEETPSARPIDPHDPTQETKSSQPEDGQPLPVAAGKVLRVEGFGQAIEHLLQHSIEEMHAAEPTDIWGGTGASSETGIAIARRETALLTELTPYQANVATVCKYVHIDVDRYVAESGETIKLAYLAEGADKPEIREISPETAKLAMDMDYTIGSDTPESKYAAEQMSMQRVAQGVYGMSEHRENIGIKDPSATENRMAEDRLVSLLLGSTEQPGIIDETYRTVMSAYAKATLEQEFGPPPVPPPQLVNPQGMPITSQPMPGAAPTPQGIAPPTQTLPAPNLGATPVTPGGMAISV